jgi:hypothetical protein
MIEVEIQCDAGQGMELVRELREQGLVQGRDFDFAYHPYTYDNFTGAHSYRRMVFAFYKDKYGTFYSLKWSNSEK